MRARHKVMTHLASGASLLDRSGRPPVGRVDEPDLAIDRIRTHPIPKMVDPGTSSAACNACVAGKASPPARLGRGEAPVPRPTKPSWAVRGRRSPRWRFSVTILSPKRAGGTEDRLAVTGHGEGTWRLTPLGRLPWSTMPSRTRAGLAASRQVAHHPDECVQSPWGMRCRTMPDRRRTGFPPYRADATS